MVKKVVIASGYFDPLHKGHLDYLKQAKAYGNELVVIVNNSSQAARKKGHEFMPCVDRANIVLALEMVDAVEISIDTDASVCKSIEMIVHARGRDIEYYFVNGGDRHKEEIPEAVVCNALNVDMVDGLGDKIESSSNLIARSDLAHNISSADCVVFDVDGVLVPRGTKIERDGNTLSLDFKVVSPSITKKIRELVSRGVHVNISSGRSLFMLMEMFRPVLDVVSFTFENGSAYWCNGEVITWINPMRILQLYPELNVLATASEHYKGFEPKEFLITIHSEERILSIEEHMRQYVDVYCLWNGEAYDIGFEHVNKGTGLIHMSEMTGDGYKKVVAIGDNVNDQEMLDAADIGISADEECAKGDYVLEEKDGVLPGERLLDLLL